MSILKDSAYAMREWGGASPGGTLYFEWGPGTGRRGKSAAAVVDDESEEEWEEAGLGYGTFQSREEDENGSENHDEDGDGGYEDGDDDWDDVLDNNGNSRYHEYNDNDQEDRTLDYSQYSYQRYY